jgi:murein DD-endopeptidase MepM/ murein hydrolase activator NlpD
MEVYIVNGGPAFVNVVIELTRTHNTGFSPPVISSKFPHLVAPNSERKITIAVPLKKGSPATFEYRVRFAFGHPSAMADPTVLYQLPFPQGARGVLRSFTGLPSLSSASETSNAVEILLPLATDVLAAREGVVIDGRGFPQDPSPNKPSPFGDFISILHSDGTWAQYAWLSPGSIVVTPGQVVAAGDLLAKTGANPVSVDTFLHFAVMRNLVGLDVRSLPFKFGSKFSPVIDAQSYSGPVSPDLAPLYPAKSDPNDSWRPSEASLPTPPVRVDTGDESLSPYQRQLQVRQRIVERSSAAAEGVNGSRPLITLLIVSIVVVIAGSVLALLAHSTSEPRGALAAIWHFAKGRAPTGPLIPDDDVGSAPPHRIRTTDSAPQLVRSATKPDSRQPEAGEILVPPGPVEHVPLSRRPRIGTPPDRSAQMALESPFPASFVEPPVFVDVASDLSETTNQKTG